MIRRLRNLTKVGKGLVTGAVNTAQCRVLGVELGEGALIRGVLRLQNTGTIVIGRQFTCNSDIMFNPIGGQSGTWLVCRGGAHIRIGNNVAISNSTLYANTSITLEDDVMIGGNCKIFDSDFHSLDAATRVSGHDTAFARSPVVIGRGAFIGGHSIVLKGVTIGPRAVIGAGSVVSRSVPPDEVWAGNPARRIR